MFCVFLIFLSALLTITRGQYGADCILPNEQSGICMPVKSCKILFELFKTIQQRDEGIQKNDQEKLQRLRCGTMKNNPLICCPASEIQLNPDGLNTLKNNSCGTYSINKVSNGYDATLSGFPWMALLKFDDIDEPFKCGGSLINDQYVLTAAHCINEASYPLIGIRLGEHRISTNPDCTNVRRKQICAPPVEDFGVEEIIKHENYNDNKKEHDIALIRLNRKVEMKRHIKAICLPIYDELRMKEYEEYVISGWGLNEEGDSTDVLQVAVVPSVERADCQKKLKEYRFNQIIDMGRICAGGRSYVDTCKGDSGGPIGYKDNYEGNTRFIQFGIVSLGVKFCGVFNAPALYTNTSHYMQWITDHIW